MLDAALDLPRGTVAARLAELLMMLGVDVDTDESHGTDSVSAIARDLITFAAVMVELTPEVQLRVIASVRETLRLATVAAGASGAGKTQ